MSAVAESRGAGVSGNEPLMPQPAILRIALKALPQARHRLLLAIIAVAFALVVAFAASPLWLATSHQVTLELDEASVFHAVPPFIAELKHGKARMHAVRLDLVVEVPGSQRWRLDSQQSAIENAVKARLRDYDRRELEGKAGADRLRADILGIVNSAIMPAVASGVLYQQLIVD